MGRGLNRGDDIVIGVTLDGEEQEGLSNVQSFSSNVEMRLVEENFLGESGPDVSEISDGASGSIGLKPSAPGAYEFILAIYERANRNNPNLVVNILEQITFAGSGEVRVLLYPDVAFGTAGMSMPSRDSHKDITLNWRTGKKVQLLTV